MVCIPRDVLMSLINRGSHAREGGHPVRRSICDLASAALEYWVPAHSRSKNGVASLAYGGDDAEDIATTTALRLRQRLAVDAGFVLQIVDCHVSVVPGQPRARAETLGQLGDALFGEPGFRRFPALPQVDAAGAGVAVQVVLADEAL